MITTCDNETTPVGALTPDRGLNPLLDYSERGLAVKATRTCSVDSCGKPHLARGYCSAHYTRVRIHGSPDVALKAPNGTRAGCSVSGCEREHDGLGYCAMHRRRLQTHGTTGPRPMAGPHNPNWSASPSYSAIHRRLARTNGAAAALPCADGCGSPAAEWAYDYTDPFELPSADGPYSVELARYRPLCKSCHKLFDLAHREAGAS